MQNRDDMFLRANLFSKVASQGTSWAKNCVCDGSLTLIGRIKKNGTWWKYVYRKSLNFFFLPFLILIHFLLSGIFLLDKFFYGKSAPVSNLGRVSPKSK